MKRCGLLGRKLSHSFSPFIHNAFGGYCYELFEIEPEQLSDFMLKRDFHGINVTIPYKKDVIPFCAELSESAKAIGSVNTLLRRPDGTLFGDNTDAAGFAAMIKQSGIDPRGKKVLVLGSGGSSLTACYVLKNHGAGEIVVVSRSGENNYENINLNRDAQIIVNTTPIGMYPNTGDSPVDISCFGSLSGVLDIVYNPARTRLLMQAEALEIPHLGGLTMLVSQARAANELFSGRKSDKPSEADVIRRLQQSTENIILIGMPGCGKSTIGRALAEIADKKFKDSDLEIEKTVGCGIPEIFEAEGEESFRKRESEILESLGRMSGLVIATGGGCVTREVNYFHLRQNGIIVFLERDIDNLERNGRPLSQDADLSAMYEKRLPIYRRFSDIAISNDADPHTIAKNILEKAYEYSCD